MSKVLAHSSSRSARLICMLFSCLVFFAFAASPALAHHKDGHDNGAGSESSSSSSSSSEESSSQKPAKGDKDGDADSDPDTTYTEDNDTNDGNTKNNVSDDGDNAHPSGKDRSVEHGKSSSNPNQGKAESDPDDDGRGPDRSNGGPDKPNGSGGVDPADQDGNNGCGNDDDFEDDNEGHCGRPAKPAQPSKPVVKPTCPSGTEMKGGKCVGGTDVVKPTCPSGTEMKGGKCKPATKPDKSKAGKITICHATGSATNPYVVITISENGLNGHGDHEGDIIPMPAGGCPADHDDDEDEDDTDTPEVDEDGTNPEVDEDVLGNVIVSDDGIEVDADTASPAERGAKVLGAVLPFTGASLLGFLGASLALIAAGLAALKIRKS